MNPYQLQMPQAQEAPSPYAMDDPDAQRQRDLAQFQAWLQALQAQSQAQKSSGGGGLMKKFGGGGSGGGGDLTGMAGGAY